MEASATGGALLETRRNERLRRVRLTIVGGVRERLVVTRCGRGKTVCARGACPAWSSGPSTSPLGACDAWSVSLSSVGTCRLAASGCSIVLSLAFHNDTASDVEVCNLRGA